MPKRVVFYMIRRGGYHSATMSDSLTRRSFLKTAAFVTGAGCGSWNIAGAFAAASTAPATDPLGDLSHLAGTHDLRLPDWGSYSKKYNGLSHVADLQRGVRFDLSVFPSFFRREVKVPNVNWESGFYPWEASADLSYFSYRYELEWKDRVYCDVSFGALSPDCRLIRAEFVNRTEAYQNTVLHMMASIHRGPARPVSSAPSYHVAPRLPDGAVWIHALDYTDLQHAKPRAMDSLTPDGLRRGEIRDPDFVDGGGIARGFGGMPGDRVQYAITLAKPLNKAVLIVRYRNNPERAVHYAISGTASAALTLPSARSPAVASVELGALAAGRYELTLTAGKHSAAELNGFVLVEASEAEKVAFENVPFQFTPEILPGPIPHSRLLKYAECPKHYGVAWRFDLAEVRQLKNSELDRFLRYFVHDHVREVIPGDDLGHYFNVYMRPIPLAPNTSKVVYGIASVGNPEQVAADLRRADTPEEELEKAYLAARKKIVSLPCVPAGEPYRFSQQRMATTTLTNVVFPVYTKRKNIRHNSPGKWWDSLYSWDSGFIGLGLLELDVNRAVDCLNAYMTEPGDKENAFILHGTPLPVQHYLFQELWNRTQSRSLLEFFYPRLRQYHLFLAGRLGSSTTRTFKSKLLKTWDYFYNTGWDDYPPQMYMHANKLTSKTATAIVSSHLIRTSRMLAQVARVLGIRDDIAGYEEDIATWTDSLQKYSWDPAAGYYGYVLHDDKGEPEGLLKHESGCNFNMGMDGVMPLLAGICTPEQITTLLGQLQSPKKLWTPIGLSTVDQSAPYYRIDGYWNGAVWMPHQWFLWKAMLDLGEAEFAHKIAQTALDLWKTEVNESYQCFEHFLIESRRGAGWHQFSALSTPVLSWFGAYYRPGRLTVGYDAWIHRSEFGDQNRTLTAEMEMLGRKNGTAIVLATMNPGGRYRAVWNDQPVNVEITSSGTLQIRLPSDAGRGRLEVAVIT